MQEGRTCIIAAVEGSVAMGRSGHLEAVGLLLAAGAAIDATEDVRALGWIIWGELHCALCIVRVAPSVRHVLL
jgi:hypothetical protein